MSIVLPVCLSVYCFSCLYYISFPIGNHLFPHKPLLAGGSGTMLSRHALQSLGRAVELDFNDTIFTPYDTFADDGKQGTRLWLQE